MDQNEHKEKELEEFEEYRYEIENRVRNLCWTVSGDYSLNLKLDTISYTKSPYISLYDAVRGPFPGILIGTLSVSIW